MQKKKKESQTGDKQDCFPGRVKHTAHLQKHKHATTWGRLWTLFQPAELILLVYILSRKEINQKAQNIRDTEMHIPSRWQRALVYGLVKSQERRPVIY